MDQAAWNLCPVSGVVSGSACYYADDQTFTDLSGTTTVVIDDCPDGKCLHSALCYTPSCALLYCPLQPPTQCRNALLHLTLMYCVPDLYSPCFLDCLLAI